MSNGFEKIENGVVNGYKKIENGVVTGYKKIEECRDSLRSRYPRQVYRC